MNLHACISLFCATNQNFIEWAFFYWDPYMPIEQHADKRLTAAEGRESIEGK